MNIIANANDDSIFLHKYYKLMNKFEIFVKLLQINFIACINVKLPKTQISKNIQWRWFLGKLLEPLVRNWLSLAKREFVLLAKSISLPLVVTAAVSERNGGHLKEHCWILKCNTWNLKWKN